MQQVGRKVINQKSFYGELQQIFYHFPKYHIKFFLGDFNVKLGREDILKLTIGNESLHQDSNENGVRILHCATSEQSSYSWHDISTPKHS
jgi:hypothetical protein